jgi:membrane peptidoglycan carboxypeptidase
MGNGDYGFQASATKEYGRPLSELDDLQLAKLVVIARWPTYYRHQAQAGKLEQAAERLLSQVRPGRHAPSPADVSDAR